MDKKFDIAVGLYVQEREVLRKLVADFEIEENKHKLRLAQLEGFMLQQLETIGGNSVSTPHGTFYKYTKYSASLNDPGAFMDYVISNQRFELMDRRANVTAVKDFAAEQKCLPPGVNLSGTVHLGVQKPRKKNGGNGGDVTAAVIGETGK